jgi:hypothetical protein
VPGREVGAAVERDLDPPEIEGTGPVAVAASKLFRHQSVIARKELLHGALIEAGIGAVGIDKVWSELRSYEEREFFGGSRARRGRSAGRHQLSRPPRQAYYDPQIASMSRTGFSWMQLTRRSSTRPTCPGNRQTLSGSPLIAMGWLYARRPPAPGKR